MIKDQISRIRARREELGWTQSELASAADTNQPTIDRIERGVTRTSKHLSKILLALGLKEQVPAFPKILVVGYVGSGQVVLTMDEEKLEELEAPPGVENGIAIIVRGNSMAPRFDDGDYVIVDKVVCDPQDLIGRTCYVKLADGRCYLKELYAGTRASRYTLKALDGTTFVDVVIEQAYPIAWIRPKQQNI